MIVLNLFDGMSCGQIALKELKIPIKKYHASEIDKFAIGQTQLNFPETIQLGSITEWRTWNIDWKTINLILAGSPCQGFSFAGKQLNFNDERSKLFFVFVDILNHIKKVNPNVKFLLENVIMKKEYQKVINDILGIFPIRINSNLVSAQNRKRLYWSNIKIKQVGLFNEIHTDIEQPKDKGILLKDIIESGYVDRKKSHCIDANYFKGTNEKQYLKKSRRQIVYLNKKEIIRAKLKHSPQIWKSGNRCGKVNFPTNKEGKAKTLVTMIIKGDRALNHIQDENGIRILTPLECARLQTIPSWYKWECSDTQQYKMLGNGWTIEVIKHILLQLPPSNK